MKLRTVTEQAPKMVLFLIDTGAQLYLVKRGLFPDLHGLAGVLDTFRMLQGAEEEVGEEEAV